MHKYQLYISRTSIMNVCTNQENHKLTRNYENKQQYE